MFAIPTVNQFFSQKRNQFKRHNKRMKSYVLAIGIVTLFYVQDITALVNVGKNELLNKLLGTSSNPLLPIITTTEDLIQCYYQTLVSGGSQDPDVHSRTPELASVHGYSVQTHTFTTEDDYILNVFRVRNDSSLTPNSRVVILTHGLGGSSAQWFIQKGNRNLAMLLADLGYDVWVTNSRGTTYSQGHVTLSREDSAYWDFSWHEMEIYDVPALLNYVETTTGQNKMYYAGHSQGTTQLMAALSERPELNAKIETAFLLSPIAFISHSTSIPLQVLAPLGYNLQYLADPIFGGHSPFLDPSNTTLGTVCAVTTLMCPVCTNLEYLFFGYDGSQADFPRLEVALSVFPDTAPTKGLVHYAQQMAELVPTFRQFDYGLPSENEKYYGTGVTIPPSYDLSKVSATIVALYGLNDNLGVPQDAEITFKSLGVVPANAANQFIEVNWPYFNHMDFAVAKDADTLVYSYVVNNLTP